jgi:hypothetical protein
MWAKSNKYRASRSSQLMGKPNEPGIAAIPRITGGATDGFPAAGTD